MSTAATDPSFLALQQAVAGRFSLETELGRGGMGIVYLARDVLLERPVAIKLLAPALGRREDMRHRFLREARIAAQCFHPHIVPIHEVAESGDLAWFVMGYVPGETLADRLRRAGPLPADTIRRIGREIGWALAYAHERGVVHRDVKPENILLEQGTGRALIADFGIAWHDPGADAAAARASSGAVMGTLRYMAPEQARGEVIDGRADLYALGVTLHVAATGQHPFDGSSALAVMAQQQEERAPGVRVVGPQLPVTLGDAIDRCLAPVAADRFGSAADFVAALERTPDGAELPAEARATRAAVLSTTSFLDWGVSIALCSFFLIVGEAPRSFGRGIMVSMVEVALGLLGVIFAVRVGDVLLSARRALLDGVAPEQVADAMAPPPTAPLRHMGPNKALALLVGGFALAFAQGTVDTLELPVYVELAGNLVTWMAPPMLVHSALTGYRRSNGLSTWLHAFVRRPFAQRLVGWLGGRTRRAARPIPADAPTEVLLGQAASDILARLPASLQQELKALPAAALALAEEAVALRARATAISGEQRRLRADAHPDAARGQRLDAEREAVQGRLGATIAALEAVRLDLLRVEAQQSLPGSLTEQLDVVRDLQRRVDAADDVHRLLRPWRPEPTPV